MDDNFKKYFGMMIPHGVISTDIKPDPNGVPIYAKCPAYGPCACTGACRRILSYDTDPEKIKVYHENIERRNHLLKERLTRYHGQTTNISGDGKIRVWTWELPKKD